MDLKVILIQPRDRNLFSLPLHPCTRRCFQLSAQTRSPWSLPSWSWCCVESDIPYVSPTKKVIQYRIYYGIKHSCSSLTLLVNTSRSWDHKTSTNSLFIQISLSQMEYTVYSGRVRLRSKVSFSNFYGPRARYTVMYFWFSN